MKSYDETVRELFALHQFSIKMGLENIQALCSTLDNPHLNYPSLHIAGTNGKGSTAIILHNILSQHGLNCGLYTSPHLIDFRERIRINGHYAETDFITSIWETLSDQVLNRKATFFDTTTAIAFEYFSKKKVDIAIIETGLGGRLDSTNILQPLASIITPIHYDHQKQLGSDLKAIAAEKAAIIKPGSVVFSANQTEKVGNILKVHADGISELIFLSDIIEIHDEKIHANGSIFSLFDKSRHDRHANLKLILPGQFQIENAVLAYSVSRWYLEQTNINFSNDIFRNVLKTVVWPGRLQCIGYNPNIYLDVSHNTAGVGAVVDFFKSQFNNDRLYLLFGLLSDKDYQDIVKILSPHFAHIFLTEPLHERRLAGEVLTTEFAKYGKKSTFIKEIIPAYEFCLKEMAEKDTLAVIGSHFLIGSLLTHLQKKHLTTD